jgi:L-iditol 2-dehydrogenase
MVFLRLSSFAVLKRRLRKCEISRKHRVEKFQVFVQSRTFERKMKAVVYYSQRNMRVKDVPTPRIEEDEILVNMKACGVCGSDLMDWYLRSRAPLVLGHEPAGVVARKGRKVEGFSVNDRVFVHHHVACMTCHYCLHGDHTLCQKFHETNIEPGSFAEYFKVPASNVRLDTLKIPDHLSFEEATLIEPVGCCIRALRKCEVHAGDSIAVIGAGATGLIHTALARIYGASPIFVSDLIGFRLDFARKFGADFAINPNSENLKDIVRAETGGRGADVVVVTAPNLEAYKTGMDVCRKGGKISVFAPTIPEDHLQISPKELFFSEVKIIPSYSTSHLETRSALSLMETGRLRVGELVTHRFRLKETGKAFATALEGRESLKVVVLNE